jgi:hypothetical protein
MISFSEPGCWLLMGSEGIACSVVVIPDSINDARTVDSRALGDFMILVPRTIKDYYFDSHAAMLKDGLLNCRRGWRDT